MSPNPFRTLFALLLIVTTAITTTSYAQDKPVPAGGIPIIEAGKPATVFTKVGDFTLSDLTVKNQPFTEAVRAVVRKRGDNPWTFQLQSKTIVPIQKGDILLATFWARCPEGGSVESGEGTVGFVFELNRAPHTKSADFAFGVGREWRRFDIPFTSDSDFPPGDAVVNFRLGFQPQTIELGGIRVVNYEKSVKRSDLPSLRLTYPGREMNAAWRKAANERIEKIRKGEMSVRVTDAWGKPVSGAQVSVVMTKHAFPFGSAVAAAGIEDETPDGQKYREIITQNFNRVVMENDLKWPGWESTRNRSLRSVAWLRERGIEVRGHNLIWPGKGNLPRDIAESITKGEKDRVVKRINDHFTDILTATRGQLVEWDVVNEPYANHDVQDLLGTGRDALVEWFRLARSLEPTSVLFLNDYPPLDGRAVGNAHLQNFYDNIKYLKDKGAPIQGIGFQGHIGSNVTPPTAILSGLDRFATFKLPIAITEFDINTSDEALQGDYMRDFLTATFSHPAVDSIIMWGFWEGRHWIPAAALWRRDWSMKPSGKAWMDLVQGEWKTKASLKSGRDGLAKTRAFYGDYTITVTQNGKTVTQEKVSFRRGANGAAPAAIVVQLPK